MKKHIVAEIVFFLFVSLLNAQIIHDPNDPIYRDINLWSVQGYITSSLPLIRPYPAQLIDTLLSEVIKNGNSEARAGAAKYLESKIGRAHV
jgi:hypothetical protein